jgi:hypothetical protein
MFADGYYVNVHQLIQSSKNTVVDGGYCYIESTNISLFIEIEIRVEIGFGEEGRLYIETTHV